jgi:hypothetical protein
MKRWLRTMCVSAGVLCVLLTGSAVQAGISTFIFTPTAPDLNDLDHGYYYTWGIRWQVPTNEQIVEAYLTYDNIYDWTSEDGDHLYTHLLQADVTDTNGSSSPNWVQRTGYQTILKSGTDSNGGDQFVGQGPLLDDWSDPAGGSPSGYDHVVNIPHYDANNIDLFAYLSDGNIGFGIDPDCHYYNDGVTLTIKTSPVPAPGAAVLGLIGLGLVRWVHRRCSKGVVVQGS